MDVLTRNHVQVSGRPDGPAIVFAHGFGCDQNMWRFVAPEFEADHRVVVFDFVGAGGSDLTAYDPDRYATLDGYATDVVEIAEALDLTDAIFVGHSVSSMIGVLAAGRAPGRFGKLVLVGPSPRYIDDDGYTGGFTRADIEELWSRWRRTSSAGRARWRPRSWATPDRPELGEELTESFCRTDPEIAARFARATFLSDNRTDLAGVGLPTLVLQCSDDVIAPDSVGEYVHRQIPGSTFVKLEATGHCPNLSAPRETTDAIRAFI